MFLKYVLKLLRYFRFNSHKDDVGDTGLILVKPREEDYQFGSILSGIFNNKVLAPNSDWQRFLPPTERQSKRILDTMGCVTFSALNILETLIKARYVKDINFSDRFTAKLSGTTRVGNYAVKVGDSIRKDGLVREERWPFEENLSWDEYYKAIPEEVVRLGKNLGYEVKYEWVKFTPKSIIKALKYAPLQVAVKAWYRKSNGQYYAPSGPRYNHMTMLKAGFNKVKWQVFDSYDPFIKDLEWNYDFYSWALKYEIKKKLMTNDLHRRLVDKYIIRPESHGEAYFVKEDSLQKINISITPEHVKKDFEE